MTLSTTFLGTSTVHVTDGASAVLVDGYFSRPALLKDDELDLTLEVRPDDAKIDAALARAGIDRLDLVVVSHTHLDHAMDSPLVARKTGARLLGTASARMIAQGYAESGLDVDLPSFALAEPGSGVRAGSFTVTPLAAIHSNGDRIPGEITEPLHLPAGVADYRTGGCLDILIAHDDGTVLVHPTANFIPGALAGISADVLYLGAGAAGNETAEWREAYWGETVRMVGAKSVRLVHWERFWDPIDAPPRPLPPPFDDFATTLAQFQRLAAEDGVDLAPAEVWLREEL